MAAVLVNSQYYRTRLIDQLPPFSTYSKPHFFTSPGNFLHDEELKAKSFDALHVACTEYGVV